MAATVAERLGHILEAISNIRKLLHGKRRRDVEADPFVRAAFERFVEIISEASRYVPEELKARHPQIEWIDIRDIGNRLRHGYDGVDTRILWNVYEQDLDPLEKTVRELIDSLRRGEAGPKPGR